MVFETISCPGCGQTVIRGGTPCPKCGESLPADH